MRDSRTLEVSGLKLDIQIQTVEHHRHTQLKTTDMNLLFEELRVAAQRWLQTLDEIKEFNTL